MQRTATLEDAAVTAFAADSKVGLLATLDEGGLPHVTLITTLQALDPARLAFGQFCEGAGKSNLRRDPRAAFLVMTLDRRTWSGRARWTGAATEGDVFEAYNRKPLFRYNAYFGIHTVHFLDVVSAGACAPLFVPGIAAGVGVAAAARPVARLGAPADAVLTPWAAGLLDRPDSLKFVAWVGADGWPDLVGVVPAAAAGRGRVVLATLVAPRALAAIPDGAPVAVFALSLRMESTLVRGRWSRGPSLPGVGPLTATVDLDWAWNSMPPKQGRTWPPVPLRAVDEVRP